MQSIHMVKESQRAMKYGLIVDTLFLCFSAFLFVVIFSFVLTPLGWMHMTTVAVITFAVSCPVHTVLLFKSRRWRVRWTASSALIGYAWFTIAIVLELPRLIVDSVWFAATAYVAASLASKLIYKWFKRHDRTHE